MLYDVNIISWKKQKKMFSFITYDQYPNIDKIINNS